MMISDELLGFSIRLTIIINMIVFDPKITLTFEQIYYFFKSELSSKNISKSFRSAVLDKSELVKKSQKKNEKKDSRPTFVY